MSFRKVLASVFVLAMALLVVAPGVEAKSGRIERRIALTATSAGRAIDASGSARFRVEGSRQDLRVEVEARVAAGTRLSVYVTHGGTTVKAGTITVNSLHEGELELKNYDGKRLPAGVGPVNTIAKVTVKNANGTVILSGSF
ncbi:MAG TPA: hypothetical protein VH482_22590 [Thermomicrobiales bacterium]|jgi:hypothetical protein